MGGWGQRYIEMKCLGDLAKADFKITRNPVAAAADGRLWQEVGGVHQSSFRKRRLRSAAPFAGFDGLRVCMLLVAGRQSVAAGAKHGTCTPSTPCSSSFIGASARP